MNNKWLYIVGVIAIAGFAVLGVMEMQNAATPYVTTVDALKDQGDRPVQFIGTIVHDKTEYDDRSDTLRFQLKDDAGNIVDASYLGVKPSNFDDREKAVVRGIYRDGELRADTIQLKCPSKYQGK